MTAVLPSPTMLSSTSPVTEPPTGPVAMVLSSMSSPACTAPAPELTCEPSPPRALPSPVTTSLSKSWVTSPNAVMSWFTELSMLVSWSLMTVVSLSS
jgi:hypothetical protein